MSQAHPELQQVAQACLIVINLAIPCNRYKDLVLLQVPLVAGYDVFNALHTPRKQEQHITGTYNLQPAMQSLSTA